MRRPGLRCPLRFAIFLADMPDTIAITVNGEMQTVAPGDTVAALLRAIGLDTRKVAVERNEEIVPRSTYATVPLAPGDRLEIVHFIGGG
ncbi:sulfur carrier protein ThiS [Neoroseomonas eburnea]|uniref:sulfur carrier protein ThiS n=1 Tax=Neoroseomonas eburnea TaxID=1346889 RepID=UPI001FE3C9DB